ncbi:hypothetical protein E3U43_009021 [Larimichthys crocea]|uniref:Uncharacterized protein n=1 Tax=Larimichthys crocea TaxID=215358 RepID=A0ACD3RW78_LARCR|nr:hypothetical protein E3U43_009021 [Larimichthys crocea]
MIDKVFGVDEQDAVCVSRLGGADQRERLTSQRTTTWRQRKAWTHGDRGAKTKSSNEKLSGV